MTSKGENGSSRPTPQQVRAARLEVALRDNLKKRKDLARARGVTRPPNDAETAQTSDIEPESGDGGPRT